MSGNKPPEVTGGWSLSPGARASISNLSTKRAKITAIAEEEDV